MDYDNEYVFIIDDNKYINENGHTLELNLEENICIIDGTEFTLSNPTEIDKSIVYTIQDKNSFYEGKLNILNLAAKLVDENYSTKQHGVADSLIQRLSVIKGELWYKASYGLPLLDKIKSKGIMDSVIINIITDHPDVVNIEYFNSQLENNSYSFTFICNTIYNENIKISYKL